MVDISFRSIEDPTALQSLLKLKCSADVQQHSRVQHSKSLDIAALHQTQGGMVSGWVPKF